MFCHCIGVTSRIWPSQAKLELTNHDLSKKPFLLRFMRFFSSAMEKEMRGKVIIYRSRGEHPTIQCEFIDYFDSKKYILKQKCMYGFLTFMLINALLFCPWNYQKMTLKSRIHYQNCRIFQYCSDSPNLKLCFMKTAHRATYIQWLWREIYFWTFMCFPRSRRNDKVHARIFLMGSSKSTKCHIPFFEIR